MYRFISRSLFSLLFVLLASSYHLCSLTAQENDPQLLRKVEEIAKDAQGKVSVAWEVLPASGLHGGFNPTAHPPMQSVFKLPLAIAVLHLAEEGKFTLDQSIRFRAEDRFPPPVYSPLQTQYPNAEVDIPMRKWLELAVSDSDNVAADRLLQLAGGAAKVREFIASTGVDGFHMEDGERALHLNPSLQYRNWFEPKGAVQLLARINDASLLTKEHTALLLGWMQNSSTQKRISGDLPEGTVVEHKTGSSDTDQGLTSATNDIGLITLPSGRKLALAVFVTDSKADQATRNEVISRIARLLYDEAKLKSSPR